MAKRDVFLLEPIDNLGHEGDCVSVKAGYARNYLLKRKLALPVNNANEKYIAALQKRREERLAKEFANAKQIAAKLEGLRFAIPVKTGEGGKLFGSVNAADLIARIKVVGNQQWGVRREYLRRLKKAFDEHGLELVIPARRNSCITTC